MRVSVVPFSRQSFEFTCGPACLIMAMRRFDPVVVPSKELEIDIWREANLVEAYATSRQGLALAARRRGFRVRTQGNVEAVELIDCLGIEMSPENRKVAEALHRDLKARCRQAGIRDALKPVTLPDISRWLGRGWVPIALVDARLVGDEAIPHWVVLTACDGNTVRFHDPLARTGETVASAAEFVKRLGFRNTSCAVIVEGGKQGAVNGAPPRAPSSRSRGGPRSRLRGARTSTSDGSEPRSRPAAPPRA